ncbi:hypothetical protein KL941_003094 [Ogataea angusta]|nr:hypothetical protein KL941_003094 [Ogataea angusta]
MDSYLPQTFIPQVPDCPMQSETPGLAMRRKSGGKHQMAACCFCKKRRKKCDGKYPSCSACLKLGIDCTVIDPPTGREIKRNYLEILETKLQQLTTQLESATDVREESSIEEPQAQNPAPSKSDLAQQVGYITLQAAGESRYLGESSAYYIAKTISESINCYTTKQNTTASGIEEAEPPQTVFSRPSMKLASSYLTAYKNYVQCQYPFLDWNSTVTMFNQVMNDDSQDPEALFFVYIIFAIGTQLLEDRTQTSNKRSYYEKAFENIGSVIGATTLRAVQAYLLITVFAQKMPDGSSCWQTTGLAIRTAVALGLHRKPYRNCDANLEDLRSRVFWSAYGMERINALVLGRPFSISDADIDAPFPQHSEETRVACHVARLRRIQSNICTFIYKPAHLLGNPEDIEATRVQIVVELNDWMATFPFKDDAVSTFETDNWSIISYHNSMLLLLRPVVLEVAKLRQKAPKETLDWFKIFTESASAICINYKNIHAKGKLSYTWLAMHCCFVSGISFIYCLWLDAGLGVLKWKRKSSIYETINACSSILYVMAEKWASACMFRDTFEQISKAALCHLEASSEQPADISNGGLLEGAIGIDHYLRNLSSQQNQNQTDGMAFAPPSNDVLEKGTDGQISDSLWEFLDTTGDRFLRNIFYDMEDNLLL